MEAVLLPISATCKALGIGRSKIYQLINEGQIDIVKIGRRTLVKVASIRALAGEGSADAA